jgi:oligopeptidase A
MNPFFQEFKTLHKTIPYKQIKFEHFAPAFAKHLEEARGEIARIKANPEAPNFVNVIEALEFAGEKLGIVSSVFFNLLHAETSPQMEEYAQVISPELSKFSNDVTLDLELFKKVKIVYENIGKFNLNKEQTKLLEDRYRGFVRNGANLNDSDKEKLRAIDQKLSTLSLEFGKRVLADTNKFSLTLEKKDLAGLPDSIMEMAREEAKAKGQEGYLFTLKFPSFVPFMKYADRRDLREKMYRAFASISYHNDESDNRENVLSIAKLRFERAKILGFKTHAHYVLEERMAKTPQTVNAFLDDFLSKAKPFALRELEELKAFAKEQGFKENFMPWDNSYYSEKLKMARYDFDDEVIRPYLPVEKCLNGMFEVAKKLYGLKFYENSNIEAYHPDVKTYEVKDEFDKYLAVFYVDLHPRDGKKSGAWATDIQTQKVKNGIDHRPHVSIVCNFSKAVGDTPALLTHNELTTLFHEFGHALHMMMSKCNYASLACANVYWDFVELPSQIMENWCFEKECLDLFAANFKSGEKIPQELIDKIVKSQTFMEGWQTLRQISFGLIDMAWHGIDPTDINDVGAYESKVFDKTRLIPDVPEANRSVSFSHLFQGGYSAGYYSYKWAEVLDADAFEYFLEKGIFNKEVAKKFREHILERGGTEDPAILFRNFRGRDAKPEALLKRAGLN